MRDLRNIRKFTQAIDVCGEKWLNHANGDNFGRGATSLYLVTGCDKSQSWGIALMSSTSEVSLSFTACQVREGNASVAYSWEGPAKARVYPSINDANVRTDSNQCTFLRGFTISARRERLRRSKRSVKVSQMDGNTPYRFVPTLTSKSTPDQGSRQSFFNNITFIGDSHGQRRSSMGEGHPSDENLSSSDDSGSDDLMDTPRHWEGLSRRQAFHPSDAINEWLLNTVCHISKTKKKLILPQVPDALFSATHDEVWISSVEYVRWVVVWSLWLHSDVNIGQYCIS